MNKFKADLKQYFVQSFRKRGVSDYRKIFSRGMDGEQTVYRAYPWFYLRVLAVFFAVLTIYAVTVSVLRGSLMDRLSFYLVGGSFLDIAMLVLLYELYPNNDFSLLKLACVTFIAGSAAAMLSALIYNIGYLGVELTGWYLALTAGIGEEIAKAIPTIICIAVLRKKNSPLAGFLIGAAVGTWLSLTENAGYIWSYPQMSAKILTAVIRALGCVFSHAMWTALIGWAYCKFRKPFLNIRFYGVVLFCMATHFCIDMPLWDYIIILFAEAAVCGLATLIFGSVIFYKERRKVINEGNTPINENSEELTLFPPAHKANLIAIGFCAVFCAMLLVLAAVFSPNSYAKTVFTREDFITFAQDGYLILPEEEREYDETYANYSEYYEFDETAGEKILKNCEQYVRTDEVTYVYVYSLLPVTDQDTSVSDTATDSDPDEDHDEDEIIEMALQLSRIDVIITVDGEESRFRKYNFITDSEEQIISFYPVNSDIFLENWEVKKDKIVFYRNSDTLGWQTITMLCVCAGVAVSGTITYAVLRKKIYK